MLHVVHDVDISLVNQKAFMMKAKSIAFVATLVLSAWLTDLFGRRSHTLQGTMGCCQALM
jgi:hypothetical protein